MTNNNFHSFHSYSVVIMSIVQFSLTIQLFSHSCFPCLLVYMISTNTTHFQTPPCFTIPHVCF